MSSRRRSRVVRRPFVVALTVLSASAVALTPSSRAECALLNAGVEAGVVKRTADDPNNLKWGLGWGAHAELAMLPMLKLGPYYLHYELPGADLSSSTTEDAAFNVLGLRARILLPIPGSSIRPYGFVGLGYTWVTYPALVLAPDTTRPAAVTGGLAAKSGHFLEIPIGVGLAYEVIDIFHLSADVAYRPASVFGGSAYDDTPSFSQPRSGWSIMLGAALDL